MKLLILPVIFVLTLSACGTNEPQELPMRPSAKIDTECTSLYEAGLNSGHTSKMRSAMNKINTCLETEIKKISTTHLGGEKSQIIIEQSLKLLRTGYQRIQWEIATENVTCRPDCGATSQLTHIAAYNELLLNILDDLLSIKIN